MVQVVLGEQPLAGEGVGHRQVGADNAVGGAHEGGPEEQPGLAVLADAAAVVLLFWAPWAPIFTRSGWALAVGTITVASIGANHRLVNKPTIRGREPMRVKRLDPGRAPDAAASLLETRSGRPDQSARRARRAASADWIGAHNVSSGAPPRTKPMIILPLVTAAPRAFFQDSLRHLL